MKLTKPQWRMLRGLRQESGPRHYTVPRWKLAVLRNELRTLAVLEREGLAKVHTFAEGSCPHVEITPAGRSALSEDPS